MCLNGDNMCGGPFKHKRQVPDLIAGVIETFNASSAVTINQEMDHDSDQLDPSCSVEIGTRSPEHATAGRESKSSQGRRSNPTAKAIPTSDKSSASVTRKMQNDERPPKRGSGVKSTHVGGDGPRKLTIPVAEPGRLASSVLVSDNEV